MTDKQPEALAIAERLSRYSLASGYAWHCHKAAAELRRQHAEIERLTACLKWEQNRAERIGTHGPGCEKWGSAHFECALRAIERKDALLRKALWAMESDAWGAKEELVLLAITKELQ